MIIQSLRETVGNTPLVEIQDDISYYAKLEGFNPFGSVKDRAAIYMMEQAYKESLIDNNTEIIESSSGNFGIALAGVCRLTGNPFTCVIDPNVTDINKKILKAWGANLIICTEMDKNGSYVSGRIKIVQQMIVSKKNIYWTQQYSNKHIWQAYYYTLGKELCDEMQRVDYLFIAVSTCGTLAGTSRRIKERFPECRIIAVDVAGSQIFCKDNIVRHISGIGSGFIPPNLKEAYYDDYMVIDEMNVIEECDKLIGKGLMVGASSGAVAYAIQNYDRYIEKDESPKIIVGIFPDRGERYVDTIYNERWRNQIR